jgi:hypothetical protein
MNRQKIEQYRFGKIKINGQTYKKDLIIFPDRIMPNWRRKQGHLLCWEDLAEGIQAKPEVLVIGLGMFGRMAVPKEIIDDLNALGIKVIAKKTTFACQIFNQRQDQDNIVAALHLTC